jgi:hypothetical protein
VGEKGISIFSRIPKADGESFGSAGHYQQLYIAKSLLLAKARNDFAVKQLGKLLCSFTLSWMETYAQTSALLGRAT